jgi:hypothetical protein
LLLAATLPCLLIVPPCSLFCGVPGLLSGSARGSTRGVSCLVGRLPRGVLRASSALLLVLLTSTDKIAHEALRPPGHLLRGVLHFLHGLTGRPTHDVLRAPFGFPVLILGPPLLVLLRGPAGNPLFLRPSGHTRHVFDRDAPVGARAFGSGEVYAHLLGFPLGRRRGVRPLSLGLLLVPPLASVAPPVGLSAGVLPSR